MNRVYRVLFNKQAGTYRNFTIQRMAVGRLHDALVGILVGVSDPSEQDTDRDGMSDGHEYWFTGGTWKQMMDHQFFDFCRYISGFGQDSWDCNGWYDLSPRIFTNLAEYESRIYGKLLLLIPFPWNGTVYSDAINALRFENFQRMSDRKSL